MKKIKYLSFMITIVVLFFLIGCSNKQINVTYVDYDDTILSEQKVSSLKNADVPNVERKGYTLSSWVKTEVENDKVIFKAEYTINKYKLSFNTYGDSISEIEVEYMQTITLPIANRSAYVFLNWSFDDNALPQEFTYTYDYDITINAQYRSVNSINIRYYDFDGRFIKEIYVENINDASCEIPSRAGYTFEKWNKIETDNKILFKASYTPNNYKIIFASNSLQGINSTTVTYGDTINYLSRPTKQNYHFLGWYLNDEKVEAPFLFEYDHDITLFARWEKADFPSVPYSEFNNYLTKTDAWIANAKQYQMNSKINYYISAYHYSVGTLRTQSNEVIDYKVDKENNYYESKIVNDLNQLSYEIFRQDGDNVYFDNIKYSSQKYILSSNFYSALSSFIYDEIFFNNGFQEDASYRKIEDDHYLAYTKLGVLANSEFDIQELAKQLKVSPEIIAGLGIEIETIYSKTSNQFAFRTELKDFAFELDGIKFSLTIVISYFIDNYNQTITPFDYNQDNIILSLPKTIDEIKETTDITKKIESFESADPHYYRVEFEKGLYLVDFDHIIPTSFSILDINERPIDLGPLWGEQDVNYSNLFRIEEAGIYYLNINSLYSNYALTFIKLDYDASHDFNNPYTFNETNTVTFNGDYDFAYYKFNSDSDGILLINTPRRIFAYQNLDSKYKNYIGDFIGDYNYNFYIPIKKGLNLIVISPFINVVDLVFSTKFYSDNIDISQNLNTMKELTTEYSEEIYMNGLIFKEDFFKLNVDKEGLYTINFESLYFDYKPHVEFYDKYGKRISEYKISEQLMPGIYYIKVSMNPGWLSVYKIKYDFTE